MFSQLAEKGSSEPRPAARPCARFYALPEIRRADTAAVFRKHGIFNEHFSIAYIFNCVKECDMPFAEGIIYCYYFHYYL